MNDDYIYSFYIPEYMDLGMGSPPNKNLHGFYLKYLQNNQKSDVLEIGHGSGLLTVLFLKNNIKVTAIDKSEVCSLYLMQKCQRLGLLQALTMETVDVINYNCLRKFATIVASDDFLVHFLSLNELEVFLSKIADLLTLNGVFITDIRNDGGESPAPVTYYPIYPVEKESGNVKYVCCSSWNSVISNEIILINYKYEEMDSHGLIIKSYIKILKQRKISFDELKSLAEKKNLLLSLTLESNLDCYVLKFTKIK